MALLEVSNLRKRFGGVVAVDQVTFEVHQGGIQAIIGPNGAGKTTLFNLISGLLAPDEGTIRFKGQSVAGWKPWQIARAGMSRTFQNPSLFLQMSTLENVMVGRHLRSRHGFWSSAFRLPPQRAEERAIHALAEAQLDYVGLSHLAGVPAGSLAFGQRRMVELARALATEPELMLLDEPASGLNTRDKIELARMIRRICDRGVTILLVEHDMSLVMGISDRVLVLHNGVPIAEGPPAEIQNHPGVVRVYLGGEFRNAAAG
jgi:branched-chain amino acid transport system ATP-binding protein